MNSGGIGKPAAIEPATPATSSTTAIASSGGQRKAARACGGSVRSVSSARRSATTTHRGPHSLEISAAPTGIDGVDDAE